MTARGVTLQGVYWMREAKDNARRKERSRLLWRHVQERLDVFWAPVPHEEKAISQYLTLIRVSLRFCAWYGDSYSAEAMADRPYHHSHFSYGFEAGYPDRNNAGKWTMPPCPRLAARWKAWGQEYESVLARNPILELREVLSDVSEAVDAQSRPYDYVDDVRQWVDAGAPIPCTLPHFGYAMTQDIADKLLRLRSRVAGWWYWDEATQEKVFRGDEHGR